MIERRALRMSSSLFPLNITPAMTSIQPPLGWKGPLGPLTSGRDLYGAGLHGRFGRTVHDEVRRVVHEAGRRDRGFLREDLGRGRRGRGGLLSVRPIARGLHGPARLVRRLFGRESSCR